MLSVGAMVAAMVTTGAGIAAASGEDWYVGPGGSDGAACTYEAAPCLTINGAIGKAATGDTIHVAAGTYGESVSVTKSLTILGPNADVSPNSGSGSAANPARTAEAIIQPPAPASGAFTLDANATTLTISGLTVDMSSASLGHQYYLSGGSSAANAELTLTNNIFTQVGETDNAAVVYSYSGAGSAAITITDNRITKAQQPDNGMKLNNTGAGKLALTMTGNVWLDNKGWAANLSSGPNATTTWTIKNNWVGNTAAGIAGTDQWPNVQSGFLLDGESADTVLDVANNTFSNIEDGAIYFWTKFAATGTIQNNTFDGYSNVNGGAAVKARTTGPNDVSGVTLLHNKFSNPVGSSRAVSIPAGMGTLHAAENWWGSADGPKPAAMVGDVLYAPWCTVADCSMIWPNRPGSGGGGGLGGGTGTGGIEVAGVGCEEGVYSDVTGSNPFCAAISWLKDQGITQGAGGGKFNPTAPVLRDQMAGFVYRMLNLGKTPAACAAAPFDDVAVGSTFCGEIAWLKDSGITQGAEAGKFQPARTMTRGEMAAFLYRSGHNGAAAPACSTAPFKDVAVDSTFCGEIAWLKAEKISEGTVGGGFQPDATILRQEMAAFIFRMNVPATQ